MEECGCEWKLLAEHELSTKLTQVKNYRQTICDVGARDYLIRKINGTENPTVAEASKARQALISALSAAIGIRTQFSGCSASNRDPRTEGPHWLPLSWEPRLECWSWRRLRRSVRPTSSTVSLSRRSALILVSPEGCTEGHPVAGDRVSPRTRGETTPPARSPGASQ
jgi:hypothetical protein